MKKLLIRSKLRYAVTGPSTLIFNVEAAQHPDQRILRETFSIAPERYGAVPYQDDLGNRLLRINVDAGEITVRYSAIVEVNYQKPLGIEREIPIAELPLAAVPYLWPSRYCESDSLSAMAIRTFGSMATGFGRVEAICQWIRDNIVYQVGTTVPTTTARDVLVDRVGVCRDHAHLVISFCRALNIPARMVTGYTWYPNPPPDFHAIFEAYLDNRWVLFDATQLAPLSDVVRIATGKDASETAFATLFGPVKMLDFSPEVTVLTPIDSAQISSSPTVCSQPLSAQPLSSQIRPAQFDSYQAALAQAIF